MGNSLELFVSKKVVAWELANGMSEQALKRILALAEGSYKGHVRQYHPDTNADVPDAEAKFVYLTEAIEELRDLEELEVSIDFYVDGTDQQKQQRDLEDRHERVFETTSFAACLNLLQNISQFDVFGILEPTSYLLQFGPARAILDVVTPKLTQLNLAHADVNEVLPEQTERAEYAQGRWRERYLVGDDAKWLNHDSVHVGAVTVVGFVPAQYLVHQSNVDIELSSSSYELNEGSYESVHVVPSWSSPLNAWFMPRILPHPSPGCAVVAQNNVGMVSLIGTIQAQASFVRKQ